MMPDHNSGPGIGGVIAAMNINKILTEQDIRFELRFGEEASYAELRSSPVVIIGAINTQWATQLTSELNFVVRLRTLWSSCSCPARRAKKPPEQRSMEPGPIWTRELLTTS